MQKEENLFNQNPNDLIILEEDEEEEEKEEFKPSVFHSLSSESAFGNEYPPPITQCQSIIDQTKLIIKKLQDLFEHIKPSNDKLYKKILEIINSLTILELQFSLTLEYLQSDSDNIEKIKSRFMQLGANTIIIDSKDEISIPMLNLTYLFLHEKTLPDLNQALNSIIKKMNSKKWINFLNDIKIIHAKLRTITEFLPSALIFDKNDIFSLNKTHPIWLNLEPHLVRKSLGDPRKIEKEFKKIVRYILLANAIMAKQNEQKNIISQKLAVGFGAIYYFFLTSKAQKKANVFFADPHEKTARKVWNLPDSAIIKNFMKIMLPAIEYNKKIFITRDIVESITLESIGKELSEGTLNSIQRKWSHMKYAHLDVEEYYKNLFIEVNDNSKIIIRVLSHRKLPTKPISIIEKPSMFKEIIDNVSKVIKKKPQPFIDDVLIIHIHGGGFISMSSRSHQTYTRKWVNQLQIPIFSIDYRLAPDFPYPDALDDCWQSYHWLLRNSEEMFGIRPKKIILVGDSAGGNLVAALTIKCIKIGAPIPTGIVLAYPALSLIPWQFTPSLLLSLDDQILPHNYLKMCVKSYIGENKNVNVEKDPLLSPSITSEEILKLFPPTRILTGTKDPLHDESLRFTKRLNDLNVNVKTIIYEEMPHGFLSYDAPQGMPEAKICVEDAGNCMKELINLN